MESIKLENYIKEHGSQRMFPPFRTLLESETTLAISKLRRALRIPDDVDRNEISKWIWATATPFPEICADDDAFNLRAALEQMNIRLSKYLLLNWKFFDSLDLIGLDDLCDFFHDIWYPFADELEIIDVDLMTVVIIRSEGQIAIKSAGQKAKESASAFDLFCFRRKWKSG